MHRLVTKAVICADDLIQADNRFLAFQRPSVHTANSGLYSSVLKPGILTGEIGKASIIKQRFLGRAENIFLHTKFHS